MPDQVTEGPWIDSLMQMGVRGVQERQQVTGESLQCVCLLHGATDAQIFFQVAVPILGPGTYGKPVPVVSIRVWCWRSCGYRLTWA